MPHITVLVSNDLTHDQRVRKVCGTLLDMGFEIDLVGRLLPGSKPLQRPYETKRFSLPFKSGALFYASLNIRLFFYLLFKRTDIILANDLDTLWPAFLVGRLRSKKLVYDSHEYFTEAAGLADNKFAKKVWSKIEKWIFPKLKHVYTVNESIAEIYRNLYKVDVKVVRNIPIAQEQKEKKDRAELGLPKEKKIVLLQGAFIDINRGALAVAHAMKYLDDDVLFLLIGAGEEWDRVAELRASDPELAERIKLLPKLPFEELQQYTMNADLGLSLDKDLYLNYKLSLPNKLFDYIHAGTPVLLSPLPELKRVLAEFEIGMTIEGHEPEHIAQKIKEALKSDRRELWKKNLAAASEHYTWGNEEKVLHKIYMELLEEK